MIRWFAAGTKRRPHPWDPMTSGQPYCGRRRIVARPRAPIVWSLDIAPVLEFIDQTTQRAARFVEDMAAAIEALGVDVDELEGRP